MKGPLPLPVSCITIDHQSHGLLSESKPTEMLQGDESFQCHKCTMVFRNKDFFLYHLLSSHKKSRKSKNSPEGCEQVILRDGKYECQVCHKLFEQKSGYDGHMGNHIKDYVKRVGRGPVANFAGSNKGDNIPHVDTKLGAITYLSIDYPVIKKSHVEEVTGVVNNNDHSVSGFSERQETISLLFGDGLDTVTEGSKVIDTEGNVYPSGLNSLPDNQNGDIYRISGEPMVFGSPSYAEDHDVNRLNSMVDLVENVLEEPIEEKSRTSNNCSVQRAKLNATFIASDEASGNSINPGEDEASATMQETETRIHAIPSCDEGACDSKEPKNGCLSAKKDQLLHDSFINADSVKALGSIGKDGNITETKKNNPESLENGGGQPFPSTSEQTFLTDKDEVSNSKLEDAKNGSSTEGPSLAERVHRDKDGKIACNQKQDLKHKETTSAFSCKRSDAFDSCYFGCDGEIMVRCAQDSAAEACLNIFHACTTKTAEQANFVGAVVENENKDGILSPCLNKHSDDIDYKLDLIHLGTVRDEHGPANSEILTKDGVMPSFCSGLKRRQDSMVDYTWRAGEIVLQNGIDDMPTMGTVSCKDENEYHGEIRKLNIHSLFDDVKFGAEVHSEYNFLPPSTSQQACPEVQEVEQDFHSSNWFEKGALPLLPKVDGQHRIATACVWCGHEFNQQVDFQVEADSVGYMCSSCKVKLSGHINFL